MGEESLREKSLPVEEVTDEIRRLVDAMFDTMEEKDGIGLAAPQVGHNIRLFVVGIESQRFIFINPEIIETSQETCTMEEGCLSIPKIYEAVVRPSKVRVQFLNLEGKRKTIDAEGLLARVIQHENDHLNGVLFVDRLDEELREEAIERFNKKQENALKKRLQKYKRKG